MHLAVAQAPVRLGNVAANLATAKELVTQAKEAGGGSLDLLILPELFLTGYLLRDDLHRLAEPLPPLPSLPLEAEESDTQEADRTDEARGYRGPPRTAADFAFGAGVAGLLELAEAQGCHLIAGLVEQGRKALYNVAVVVGPEGFVGHYRKLKLPNVGPFEEKIFFGAGDPAQRPLFELPFGRVGVQICYDLFFPHLSLRLARAGAQLLVNLSAAPNVSRPYFERLLPGRAIETSCYWAYANNVGPQETLSFWGGSRLLDPKGAVTARAPYHEAGVAVVEIELADVEVWRQFRPVLRDGAGDEAAWSY